MNSNQTNQTSAVEEKEEQSYYVTLKVDARYVTEVKASSLEEAKRLAEAKFADADLGETECADEKVVLIEDDCGCRLFEA